MHLSVIRHSRRRVRPFTDERGFTLVEILVVILIIGSLMFVALPAFFNQRTKGQDAEAKLMLRAATTAMVTYHIDQDTFNANAVKLIALEPALADARGFIASGTANTYRLSVDSRSGTTFMLDRDAAEVLTRTCSNHGSGLCRSSADTAGNWW